MQAEKRKPFFVALSRPVRVGVEATGYTRWFEHMLGGLGTSCGSEMQRRSTSARRQLSAETKTRL